jgi:ABC-2 type transport system ATP-binding protein
MQRPHSADQPRSAAQSPSPARSPSPAQSPSAGQSRGAMQSHGTDQPRSAPAPAVDAVRCAGLRYRFGAHVAVDQVDLLIAPGETFGLLGPNGAGKTTTIRMLTTLLKPDEGTITVFGVDAAAQPMRVRRLIGYVPQLLSADASLTGWENVELFARLFDVPRRVRRRRVAEALSAMGLAEAAQRLVKTYSGGMIRRLELAQALVNAPRLLVLDEPVGLDPIARADVWEFIAGLRRSSQTTVLMTTHYMEEADLYCDRVALMHHGTLRATGTSDELKAGLGEGARLDDVFRHYTGGTLDDDSEQGGIRDVRRARRTARRLG